MISTHALRALVASMLVGLASGAPAADTPQLGGSVLATDEVTLRLVAGEPDAEGTVRGALVVDLAPGWKTYWIDPGDAGIPPSVDFSATQGASSADLSFPAPHRFGGESVQSNGYTAPLAIAFTLEGLDAANPASVEASVMLGICETICIPVAAELSFAPSADAGTRAVVEAAFAALPETDTARIASAVFHPEAETISVNAVPGGEVPEADLFVAGPKGWYFGAPTAREQVGDTVTFTVPILDRPRKSEGAPASIDAILTTGDRAFERSGLAVESAPRREARQEARAD